MSKPKASFLCYFNKNLFPKLFITNNDVPVNMQISSDNWPILRRKSSVSVPLWYNKDKSENPCVATGWLVCPYSFSTKNGLQMGLTRGGEKLWLHLKDKFFRLRRRIKMGS